MGTVVSAVLVEACEPGPVDSCFGEDIQGNYFWPHVSTAGHFQKYLREKNSLKAEVMQGHT